MKYQYFSRKDCPPQQEKWLYADCRQNNSEQILAGRWRLVNVSTDSNIPCCACDHAEQLVSQPAGFAAIRSFLQALN